MSVPGPPLGASERHLMVCESHLYCLMNNFNSSVYLFGSCFSPALRSWSALLLPSWVDPYTQASSNLWLITWKEIESPEHTVKSSLWHFAQAVPSAWNISSWLSSSLHITTTWSYFPLIIFSFFFFLFFTCLLSVISHRTVNSRRQGHVCLIHLWVPSA